MSSVKDFLRMGSEVLHWSAYMKKILMIAACFSLLFPVARTLASNPNMRIDAVIYGQSNADSSPRFGETPPTPSALAWYNGNWYTPPWWAGAATPPGIGQLGGSLSFLWNKHVDEVRWVTGAVNGAKISQLMPGTVPYDTLVQNIASSGSTPQCLIWWQGESDAFTDSTEYYNSLDKLWGDLQASTTLKEMIAVIPRPDACGNDMSGVRHAIKLFASSVPHVTAINIDDVDIGPDGCHYTGRGYSAVAERIEAARKSQNIDCAYQVSR